MSAEDQTGLKAGLALVSGVLKELMNESQEIMKMNPMNSLVMLNLFGDLGYALLVSPTELAGRTVFMYGTQAFFSRQDMVAQVFKASAEKTGLLVSMDAVSQVFSFKVDLGKIAAALGGAAG